jgi:Tfp pilus assembly protein PilF
MADRQIRAPELTPRQATAHYEQVVKENPGDAQAHLNLGSVYYTTGNLDAAFKEFQDARALSPGLDHAHYYLGVLYAQRGDQANARKEWELVLNGGGHALLKDQARIRLAALGQSD